MLKFSAANAKTRRLHSIVGVQKYLRNARKVYSLDLLSGWTCPAAKDCLAKVIIDKLGKRKIQDGPNTQFRCFSASQERLFFRVYDSRKHNTTLLRGKTAAQIRELILTGLPKNCGILRYHVAGDVFSRAYMMAIYRVALTRPDVLFYFYTKALHFLSAIPCLDLSCGIILPNLLVTASVGGRYNDMIPKLGIRTATVVFSESEATTPIDHTDELASTPGGSFALLLHGVQPPKTEASAAWQKIKRTVGGYTR